MKENVLDSDPWLSSILGKPSYRLSPRVTTQEAARREMSERSKQPCFIFSRASIEDPKESGFLEESGFRLMDTNMVFRKSIVSGTPASPASNDCRLAGPQDEEAVAGIAGEAFALSRFSRDPQISGSQASRIKSEWVRNFFRGKRGEAMILATDRGQVAGFLQMLKSGQGTWVIDLVAVAPDHRRKGFARKMIGFAESQLSDCKFIRVGTQLANSGSIRLYHELGFEFDSANYVYHFHGSQDAHRPL